jgi:phenylpyruvate tautomerase PptA (4-oxalocrotonate tautomerase family)
MPMYTVSAAVGTLSDSTKAELAAAITKTHADLVQAPSSFVHVVINEVPETNIFSDSVPSHPLLIVGNTRGGRAYTQKSELALAISQISTKITGVPEAHTLVIIDDTEARFAVERGRILPDPGQEAEWLKQS